MLPFIVQIRDMETHIPLPGISVGDVGSKIGYNSVDNGYLSFENYRVPRKNLLSRFTNITREGEFEVKSHPKIAY